MAQSSGSGRKKKHEEFINEIKKLASNYPELKGEYAISRVKKKPSSLADTARGETVRCIMWGRDPVTGKRICLKWEKV
jgi:hypothetical protein